VADGEIIVMEMKIVIDSNQTDSYFFKPSMERRQNNYNAKSLPEAYASVPED